MLVRVIFLRQKDDQDEQRLRHVVGYAPAPPQWKVVAGMTIDAGAIPRKGDTLEIRHGNFYTSDAQVLNVNWSLESSPDECGEVREVEIQIA